MMRSKKLSLPGEHIFPLMKEARNTILNRPHLINIAIPGVVCFDTSQVVCLESFQVRSMRGAQGNHVIPRIDISISSLEKTDDFQTIVCRFGW